MPNVINKNIIRIAEFKLYRSLGLGTVRVRDVRGNQVPVRARTAG